jgi:hypothetical protein
MDALGTSGATAPQLVVPPPPCEGDGISGPRVQVFYGHPSDTTDRYQEQLPFVTDAVARADAYLDASTPGASGQHARWMCTDGQLEVSRVNLLPIGDDNAFTFGDMVTSLKRQVELGLGDQNYTSTGVVYVVFVDQLDAVYGWAGEGSVRADDSPDATNTNNAGRAYSLIAEFDGEVVLHELMHNLGSVQPSAPHASGGWHCYENNDLMCYQDGGPYFDAGGTLMPNCPDAGTWLVDCGGDDYYNLAPAPGAYLSDHWNVASSTFLTAPQPLPEPEPMPEPEPTPEPEPIPEPEPTPDPTPEPVETPPVDDAPGGDDGATDPSTSTKTSLCTIRGTSGSDTLRGTSAADVICAGRGADVIKGLGGNDIVYAGPGRDVVYGGTASDRLLGGRGRDRLYGGLGRDRLDGGSRVDLCRSAIRRARCEIR